MPPRKRISNITRLLPRKRTSTPEPTPTKPSVVHRDCTSLPVGFGLDHELDDLKNLFEEQQTSDSRILETVQSDVDDRNAESRDFRVHRFAQRYESNQLPSYRDYPPVEEDVAPYPSPPRPESHALTSPTHQSEREPPCEHACSSCDLSSLRHELSLLRENHALLSETTRETLRLAETLEARVESMQRAARPSERLFWMLLDGLASLILFLIDVVMKPCVMTRKWFVAERVRKRRSWRLSVGDFEKDPFLGDVAKRLSLSAVDD